ncbi:hypothetical protein HU200_041529 [Digitaria exilis]|uniref:Adipocyte plasma membrane-associated protein n=1 Tax=Digitaria exilis TaxID=1010633 RepID=A0A835EDM8_9POAL|nr:hypothetical protein HU200_041529 [Digitaria exilis]
MGNIMGKKVVKVAVSLLLILALLLQPCAAARPVAETIPTIDGSRSLHCSSVGRFCAARRASRSTATAPDHTAASPTAVSTRPAEVTESRCGRPLGLRFHYGSGNLYIADAYKGLMRVGPGGGQAKVLVKKVDGVPLRFTNGVDVDQVTGEHERVTATGDSTGRLMNADRTHLVVALTGPCKLMRYWIKGPKAGMSEMLADLPGYPDNVRADRKAVRINADGQVVQVMKGPKSVRPTEVMEREGGKLYMGSIELPYVAVVSEYIFFLTKHLVCALFLALIFFNLVTFNRLNSYVNFNQDCSSLDTR